MNFDFETIVRNRNELIELQHVLDKDDTFFSGSELEEPSEEEHSHLVRDHLYDVNVQFLTGTIERQNFSTFERTLYRATRGNMYIRYTEVGDHIIDPQTGNLVEKNVFVIFFYGEELYKKIHRLCEAFGANLYPCSDNASQRKEVAIQVNTSLLELEKVIDESSKTKYKLLRGVAEDMEIWRESIMKHKSIHHALNLFSFERGRKYFIAEGWVPKEYMGRLSDAIKRGEGEQSEAVETLINQVKTTENPPTYFPLNKFTSSFQGLTDAYGVPRYREINPTVFTIVTFPFMFGVMYGDIGHGLFLLAATIFMIAMEKKWKDKKLHDMIQPAFDGRYILLLMSLFSIYAGFIYNEMFAVPTNIFTSNWIPVPGADYYTRRNHNRAYEFGVDPAWKGASNELMYYNSLKMKMSIIIGVTHMTVGLVLKLINSINFKKYLDVFFEVIPGMILLLSLFGYMCFLMFYKWTIPFYDNERGGISPNREEAPQILPMMIYMFLSPFKDPPNMLPLFKNQGLVQGCLALLAILMVPIMLLPKPLILRYQHNKKKQQPDEENHLEEEEEFEFSEIMVHQTIETIEFALGSISSTASYLRLWALSLAHAELSTVFWDLGLVQLGLTVGPFIVTFVVFGLWLGLTIGIILVMESLSAFLHALRLHWVEFQGKFYKADGYVFLPLSFKHCNVDAE